MKFNFNQSIAKLKYYFLWCFVYSIVFFSSCKEKKEVFQFNKNNFEQLIEKSKKNYSAFVIIPGSGCEGCISDAEKFVTNSAKLKEGKIMFIFTNIVSKKLLKLRLGTDVWSLPNIYIDSINALHFRSIYPTLIKINPSDNNYAITDIKIDNTTSLFFVE